MYRRLVTAGNSGGVYGAKEARKDCASTLGLSPGHELGYNFLHSDCRTVRPVKAPGVYLAWNASLTVGSWGLE
jgi:hypothetical protein